MKKSYKVINDCRGMNENEIIKVILESRSIKEKEHFLYPDENDLIPLENLKFIDQASNIVIDGIKNNKQFHVLADTDLDGISSGAQMIRYLKEYTKNITWSINQGKAHGLLNQNLERFNNADILIIVDSLDKDVTAYKALYKNGIKIIILDHHDIKAEIDYDTYTTLVSSQRGYPNPALSGAGVVWKFCKYLDGYFGEDYADRLVDLACCGLIADMSDVSEESMENRYICSKGFSQIYNPGIKKIVGSFPFNSGAVSFSIAPLINAANRMRQNESALNAFLADDNKEVLKYVKELKKCKEDQNSEVDSLMEDVIRQGDKQENNKVISIFIDTEADIAGLMGNKILEIYQRPVLVLKKKRINDEQYYMGSARAIGVDDFRKICEATGLCEAEGHPLAHGVKIKENCFDDFINALELQLRDVEFETKTIIDAELYLKDITRTLVDKIKEIDRISGNGFKPITFKIGDISDYEIGNMSNYKHLVIKPSDYFQFIKWNWRGDFEEMEDNALLEESMTCIGTLDSGFLGRKFSLKMICNEVIV